jgi:hypothetical protein
MIKDIVLVWGIFNRAIRCPGLFLASRLSVRFAGNRIATATARD